MRDSEFIEEDLSVLMQTIETAGDDCSVWLALNCCVRLLEFAGYRCTHEVAGDTARPVWLFLVANAIEDHARKVSAVDPRGNLNLRTTPEILSLVQSNDLSEPSQQEASENWSRSFPGEREELAANAEWVIDVLADLRDFSRQAGRADLHSEFSATLRRVRSIL